MLGNDALAGQRLRGLIRAAGPVAAACGLLLLVSCGGDTPKPKATGSRTGTSARGVDPFNDPNSPLYKKSVFFDFDSFNVKPEFQPVVEAHGKYLASTKNRRIVVEGHTDERGGREYNLALGQKRAEAVKQRLMLLGAADSQIETVSFGKEKPRALGSNEEAWAQNRRADIVYK